MDAADNDLSAPAWPSWPVGMPQQDLPMHVEREYKLGVPEWKDSVAALAASVDALLREAVGAEPWQAPPRVQAEGAPGYTLRDTPVQEEVFADFYFDNRVLLNWRHGVGYRLRQRFEDEAAWSNYMAGIDGWQPKRVEFMAKINSRPVAGSPGLTEVDEYQFKTRYDFDRDALPEMLRFFSLGRVPYDFEYKGAVLRRGDVGNPAWAVVDFYRSRASTESAFHDAGSFAFSPQVYVKTERSRQHLVFTPSEEFRELVAEYQESFQAFIVTVDHAHAWQADEIMAYATGEANAFPAERGSFVEVELEFERSTAARIDKAIEAAPPGSADRLELIAIRDAFLADLSHLVDLIEKRFHTVPKRASKYRQARSLAHPQWNLGVLQSALALDHVPARSGGQQIFSFTPKYAGPLAVKVVAGNGSVAVSVLQGDVGTSVSGEGEDVLLKTEVTDLQPCEIRVMASGAVDNYDLRLFCPDAFDRFQSTPTLVVAPGVSFIGDLTLVGPFKDEFRVRSPTSTIVNFCSRSAGDSAVQMELFRTDDGQRVRSSTSDGTNSGVARMAVHLDSDLVYELRIGGDDDLPCTYDLRWDRPAAPVDERRARGIAIARSEGEILAVDLGPTQHRSCLEETESLSTGPWSLASPGPLPTGVPFRVYRRISTPSGFFRRARLLAGPMDIVLNEVSSVDSVGDFVEIFNRSDEAYVFSDGIWSIKDENDAHVYVIPEGTTIAPRGFLLVGSGQLNFGLGADDTVRLYRGATVHDVTSWKGHVVSRGRFPDGGPWLSGRLTPTPDMANTP